METQGLAVDLGSAEAVWLTGPDTRRFWNGMLTNNLRDLPVGEAVRCGIVDDRARLQATASLVAVEEERFLAVLEGMTSAEFAERFEPYVLFDDVEMAPCSVFVSAFLGPAAAAPEGEGWAVKRRRCRRGGFDWISLEPVPEMASMEPSAMALLRILAGAAQCPDELLHRKLPHELGYREELLHFEKGCYLGQETIHRVDVMGKLRFALAGLHAVEPMAVGDSVMQGGKSIGKVSSVAAHPDGFWVGLASLREAQVGPCMVGGSPGNVCELGEDGLQLPA